jgi:hypothetical protein
LSTAIRALAHRDFRLYFAGQRSPSSDHGMSEAALLLPFAVFLVSRRRRLTEGIATTQAYANGHRGG